VSEVLEQGDIFFLYRPRVGATEVDELSDVQRFLVVLKPDRRRRYRELIVGRKRLPDPLEHERFWALVGVVTDDPKEMRAHLERKEYDTRTRGHRVQPEARPAGEGRYAIVLHEGNHTHLAYALELPTELGPAQAAFNIREQASFVVAVRNPEAPAPPNLGLPAHRGADLPEALLARFRGRRFAPLDPPDFLDYERVEVVLIGASEDVEGELGIRLDTRDEDVENADIFRKLRLPRTETKLEPLTRGELR
jgi:hypothetical protein